MPVSPSTILSRPAAAPARRALAIVGAALGLSAYFAVALFPSLIYGGQTGAMLAGALLLGPEAASATVRSLITMGMGLGMVLGTAVVAALFAAFGALAGSTVSFLAHARTARQGHGLSTSLLVSAVGPPSRFPPAMIELTSPPRA